MKAFSLTKVDPPICSCGRTTRIRVSIGAIHAGSRLRFQYVCSCGLRGPKVEEGAKEAQEAFLKMIGEKACVGNGV